MQTSSQGIQFISRQEGCPLTAYLDPADIPTIAHGFTLRSKIVRRELAKLGITKLIPGKTKLSQKQADDIFLTVLAEEFEPMVNTFITKLPDNINVTQGMYDALVSAVWNLGPKFLTWNWTVPLLKGDKKTAASIWAVNYNTAKGKRLPGLVRRRQEEANLFMTGRYGAGSAIKTELSTPPKSADEEVKAAQEALAKAGIPVEADGFLGPKTTAAIKKYQEMHPHLKADGILGPATMAQLMKDSATLKDAAKQVIPAVGGAGAVATGAGFPWTYVIVGAAVVAIAVAAYAVWKRRDLWQRKLNGLSRA